MSLLAPAFLLGVLAVGLPLWLHRLSSDNPNRQRFSSLMFLEPGEPRRVLAKKLQYLLLLALRIALLVLLALAFAQPTLWRTPRAAGADAARLHVVVLDASASMGHGDRWGRAQDAARDVIASLAPGDRAQLVAAGRVVEVLGAPTDDPAALRQALTTVEPGVFRLDYGALMRSLDGVLRAADLPVVLHLITDAQQTSLPTRFAELAPRRAATIEIHDVAGEDADNWAIESFGGSALTGQLQASVRSYASQPARKTVRLSLNGNVVDQKTVEVPAGGRAEVEFAALELASGSNRAVVTLEPRDDLAADDQRFLALKRAQPRAVLVVGADPRSRGVLFTNAALGTLSALALTPEAVPPSALNERSLADYRLIVVTDAGLLGPAETARLTEYVEAGGGLLLATAQRSSSLATIPVAGFALRALPPILSARSTSGIGEIDANHPALRGVEELRTAEFYRFIAVEPTPDARVLMSLDDGTPLLIERQQGAGRVLLFTSSLDREWNDLPVQPVFVPFVAGLANHLLGGAGFTSEAALGSTLAVRALGFAGGRIFDPRGEAAVGLAAGSEDVLLDQLGFYEVVGGGATELVAVNFDSRESDLRRTDAATLERWRGLGGEAPAATSTVTVTSTDGEERAPVPLGPWIVALLLLLAVVESGVGNWHLRIRRGIAA